MWSDNIHSQPRDTPIPLKITLFTHNAIIGRDAPLCHKSQCYIDDLIQRGEAFMLPRESFRRPAARLNPPKGYINGVGEELVAASHESAANTAITCSEMEANVGIADTQGAVIRAQCKIKAWMSKATSDERAPLPRGKWADFSGIQVSVVQ